jgi:PAS domain S-box-containing protein
MKVLPAALSALLPVSGGSRGAQTSMSKRRQTQAWLRLLTRAVEQSPVSIVITDKAGRIQHINPKFSEVTGYSAAEVLGQNPRILKSGEMPEAGYRQLWETILVGKEWRGKFHNRRKNGELYWELAVISAIFDEAGEITHFLAVKEDITKHQQTEEVLAQTEHLFRSFMDGIPDMVYFKDTQSRFIRANQAITNRFGQATVADLLGRTDFDFFSEEHARAAHEGEQEIIRNGQPLVNIEEKETWPGRQDTWVSTTKLPLRDGHGKVIGIFGISRDITERKRAEEKIHEQARLLDLVYDAVIVRDMENRILYWNSSAERIYGWTAREAVGQDASQLLHKDAFRHEEAKKIVLEKGGWQGEFEAQAKDGQELIMETRWTLVRDTQGNPKSILGISTDITKKKKLEAQTLRSQRMESLGTLAGGMAHDLNNILAPLLISVQLLKGKVRDTGGQKLLDTLETNVLRGAKLIKQVLAFGRGVKGERAVVQLDVVVHEIGQIICETFPKFVEFEKQLPPCLWQVTGDATQLYQVLLNLCVNARDAMPNGGRLSIHIENVEIDEIYASLHLDAKPGSYVVIKVTDTGTGIPKAIQDKMFEPFFTTKGPGQGTGLGLSTCLGIVKSHGGFINCYSEPGKGTAFKVYLPANTAPAGVDPSVTKPSGLPCGHNELVLVVDDEKAIREVAQKTLEHFGYRVLIATNGAEAVSIYQQQRDKIAVVVIDMAMPVMDGRAAITALKAISPEIRIIRASGLDTESGTAKTTDDDRWQFIPKPYTAEILLQTLHRVLAPKSGKGIEQ